MNTMSKSILLATIGTLAYFGGMGDAEAERRLNNLRNEVAVRQRKLLVKKRFELAPLFESTLNADFKHIVGAGAKLEYHFTDMLSLGFIGVGSASIDTKLVGKIVDTLEDAPNAMTREPSKDEFQDRLNQMPFHGAAYVSLTPWYGKLAAFGTAYVAFDFYFQAGASFAQLKSDCALCTDEQGMSGDLNPNNDDPLNNGSRVGLYLGGGIHVFLNDFIALDLSIRDYAFSDNPSGADVSGPDGGPDNKVTSDDNRFVHHLFFGAGVSIMFPTKAKRTN